jgi:hypothetical protein
MVLQILVMQQGYRLEMVQSLMESFSIEASHLAQYSTFDPITMTVEAEFGDSDGQLEGVESELGINRDWEADMEGYDGRTVNVVGHKKALEMTLRDRIDDIDNADRSGPSRRTDFSQSTENSTNSTDATMRMHTHRERTLTTIALVNKNSTLTNNLEDTEEQLSAMISRKQGLSLRLHWLISLLYSVIHKQHYHRIPKFQRISLSSSQTFYHLVGDIMFLFLVLGDG